MDQCTKMALQRARHYRLQQGLSEAEFARKAGISLARYKKMQKGSVCITVGTIGRLAKAAGVAYGAMLHNWPTVAEIFGSSSINQDIFEVLERIENHALEEDTYWILYLLECYRDLGDSMFRMAEAARREHLAA